MASVAIAACTQAPAASFDCKRAATATERAICADPVLSDMDDAMSLAWRAALDITRYRPALQTDQTRWLDDRNRCSADMPCLRQRNTRRLAELSDLAIAGEFTWADDWIRVSRHSATMHIVPSSDTSFDVSIEAFHDITGGSFGATGSVSGDVLTVNIPALPRCIVRIHRIHRQIEVQENSGEQGTCGGGNGVGFSGRHVPYDKESPSAIFDAQPRWDLLSLGIVRDRRTDAAMRHAVGEENHTRLIDRMPRGFPSGNKDDFKAEVRSYELGGLPDPSALTQSVLMQNESGEFWLAYFDEYTDNIAYYFTNAPEWKDRLSATIRDWINRQTVRSVKMMPDRGQVLFLPNR